MKKSYDSKFKSRVALEALRGELAVAEIARKYQDPPNHEKFPYLLRKCKIERPNQVWSTDITYTAVADHRALVIGIVDWFSRKVLAYNVVNTMDAFH